MDELRRVLGPVMKGVPKLMRSTSAGRPDRAVHSLQDYRYEWRSATTSSS